jgi:hypothetical protein
MMRWLVLPLTLLAVQVQAQSPDNATMCPLASALTKVARAVDAYAADNPAAGSLRGVDLVDAATKHDPTLVQPFSQFHITARVEGRNSSVLVCTRDQKRSLIEDAGCTARSDAQRWADVPPFPCGFSLDLAAVCTSSTPLPANLCR